MNTLIRLLRKLFCLNSESDEQMYYPSQQMSEPPSKHYVPFSDDLTAWGSISQSSYGSPSVSQRYSRSHYSVNSSSQGSRVNIGGLQGYTSGSVAGSHHSYISTSGLPPLGSMHVPRQRRAQYPNVAHIGSYFG